MKPLIKITFVAFAIAITATACDPARKTTNPGDSTKIDSTAIVADTTKKDTTAAPADSTKKDPVKK